MPNLNLSGGTPVPALSAKESITDASGIGLDSDIKEGDIERLAHIFAGTPGAVISDMDIYTWNYQLIV